MRAPRRSPSRSAAGAGRRPDGVRCRRWPSPIPYCCCGCCRDCGRDGILVNVVGTGFTATDRNRERFPDELRERVAALVPQRRLSTADDVARLVLFLGSEANTSVTGELVREGTPAARTPLVLMS